MHSTFLACFVLLYSVVYVNAASFDVEKLGKFDKNDVIIFDVDAGVDDALALLIALKAESLGIGPPVIAITCVNGNTELKNVVVNVQRILELSGRQDIPIYIGSNSSLVFTMEVDAVHGKDGFGEVPFSDKNLVPPQRKHAVNALLELVEEYPDRLVIAAVGPLTNIALVEKLTPGFLSKLKGLLIMGGSCTGVGNVSPGIEFNIYMDVEAYHIVLSNTNYKKAMLLPWDPVVAVGIPQDWWISEFLSINNSWVSFIKDIGVVYQQNHSKLYHADALMYIAYLHPAIITQIKPLRVQTVTDGFGRGTFLIDYYHEDEEIEKSNLMVIQKLDAEEYKQFMLWIFSK